MSKWHNMAACILFGMGLLIYTLTASAQVPSIPGDRGHTNGPISSEFFRLAFAGQLRPLAQPRSADRSNAGMQAVFGVLGAASLGVGMATQNATLLSNASRALSFSASGASSDLTSGGLGSAPTTGSGGTISTNCPGYPQTRPGIVQCFRDGAAYTRGKLNECQRDKRDLKSLQPTPTAGSPSPTYSQKQSFQDCIDLYQRGAQAKDCAADHISGGMQVNPAVSLCRRQFSVN